MTDRDKDEIELVRKFMVLNHDAQKFILLIMVQKLMADDVQMLIRKIDDEVNFH